MREGTPDCRRLRASSSSASRVVRASRSRALSHRACRGEDTKINETITPIAIEKKPSKNMTHFQPGRVRTLCRLRMAPVMGPENRNAAAEALNIITVARPR